MLRRRTQPTTAPDPALRGTRPSPKAMVLMALAGATSLLSFQPFGWWPLQFLALAYFFYQVGMGTSPRRGVWLGWAFGFGWSVAGMHWLYIAVTRFGGGAQRAQEGGSVRQPGEGVMARSSVEDEYRQVFLTDRPIPGDLDAAVNYWTAMRGCACSRYQSKARRQGFSRPITLSRAVSARGGSRGIRR